MDVMIALFRDTFQPPGGEMGPWMRGWGYHMGFFPIILMFLFWITVIMAILFLIKKGVTQNHLTNILVSNPRSR